MSFPPLFASRRSCVALEQPHVATDFAGIVGVLVDAGVEVVVIGGLAAQAHGSARLTQDVDLIYRRTRTNIDRLAAALAPHRPYLRGAPAGLPFHFDPETIRRGLNFTLTTALGDVDLLGEMTGGGTYEDVEPNTAWLQVFGRPVRVLAELEALLVEREKTST